MVTCKKYSLLHDKIKNITIAMLAFTDNNGRLKSIPMTTMQTECEGYIWFFTELDSQHTESIFKNSLVNVSYTDSYKDIYVSISGKAEIVIDHNKMNELWKPNLEKWLPKGLNNPKLCLLKVQMEEAEYWDDKCSKMLNLWDYSEADQVGKAHRHITLG